MNKIILFCHPRSGSTAVCNAFKRNFLPEFGTYDSEFLNAYQDLYDKLPYARNIIEHYGVSIDHFCNSTESERKLLIRELFFKSTDDKNTSLIIKFFPEMAGVISMEEMISFKDKFNLKFVSLIRQDILSFSISYAAAFKTNVWNTGHIEDLISYDNLICSKDDIKKINLGYMIREVLDWQAKILKFSNKMDLALTYENDILTPTYIEKLNLTEISNMIKVMDSYKQNKFLLQNKWIIDEVCDALQIIR